MGNRSMYVSAIMKRLAIIANFTKPLGYREANSLIRAIQSGFRAGKRLNQLFSRMDRLPILPTW